MSCDYCKKSKEFDTEESGLRLIITSNILEISYDAYSTDSSFNTSIEINYCPECGEKLNELDNR